MSKPICVPCAKRTQIDLDDMFQIGRCAICGVDGVEVGIEFVPAVPPPSTEGERPSNQEEAMQQTIQIDLATLHGSFVWLMTNEKTKKALGHLAMDLVDYLAGEKPPRLFTSQLNLLLQAIASVQQQKMTRGGSNGLTQ